MDYSHSTPFEMNSYQYHSLPVNRAQPLSSEFVFNTVSVLSFRDLQLLPRIYNDQRQAPLPTAGAEKAWLRLSERFYVRSDARSFSVSNLRGRNLQPTTTVPSSQPATIPAFQSLDSKLTLRTAPHYTILALVAGQRCSDPRFNHSSVISRPSSLFTTSAGAFTAQDLHF